MGWSLRTKAKAVSLKTPSKGQKDADTLMDRGELATSFQGLSLSDQQLVEQIQLVANNRANVVIPDNDEPGHRQAKRFSQFLATLMFDTDKKLEVNGG